MVVRRMGIEGGWSVKEAKPCLRSCINAFCAIVGVWRDNLTLRPKFTFQITVHVFVYIKFPAFRKPSLATLLLNVATNRNKYKSRNF